MSKSPTWNTVVLVCKACGKRGSGPKKTRPKAIADELRRAAGRTRPRPRVLLTGCLGLCPKAATAVALVGERRATLLVAVERTAQLAELIPLIERPPVELE